MSMNLRNIKWLWVIIGTVLALIIAYGSSICVVTGYATYLAFAARGAPDTALINEFAAQNAGGITSLFVVLGTFLGGLVAGRKAQSDKFQNGFMVGLVSALILLILNIISGFSLWTLVSLLLALAGGWLGGKLAGG